MDRLETRIPPPVWAATVGLLMFGASRLGAVWSVGTPARTVGLGIAGLGVAVAAAGIVSFVRAGTTVDPHHPSKASSLVDGGVYRLTRNPMYVGLALVVGGWGLVLRDPLVAIAGVAVFVAVITRLQIVPEERILRARFGEEYDRFRARTRRWL